MPLPCGLSDRDLEISGGTNPALRTFYYRLLRLIALSIHPVFVFDGPNKPPFKRNKRTGPNVASIPEFLAKQLLKQFGYPIHLAPGEAEAECALLQREGIVDAVLSEDVDTLMFGSGLTIRNWSPEKSGKTPTHVNVYDAIETKNGPSGLDREGMILVALMSGGDYVPEGIPGCGPKTACEAAKAGFGSDLCKIPTNDSRALARWRQRLQHELRTNESKLFKRKHGALKIPDDFPRLDILGYYTHPAISNQTGLEKLRRSIKWDQEIDFPGLRAFTNDAFDWVRLEGAKHFIRSLAPSLLVRELRLRAERIERLPTDDLQAIQEDEALLVKGIHGKRQHPVTDNSIELRVSFTPIELVKIDLDQEDPDEELESPPSGSRMADIDDDEEIPLDLEDEGPKKRGPTKFDPQKHARIWVMESIVKVGAPLKVQDWEAERQTKLKPRRAVANDEENGTTSRTKAVAKKTKTATPIMPQAPIQRFAKVTKPGVKLSQAISKTLDDRVDSRPVRARPTVVSDEQEVIDLLSSPTRLASDVPVSPVLREKLVPSILDNLPPSVTKRRRRAPMQRSQTLPADCGSPIRSLTPPPVQTLETIDLLSSPIGPSPARLPAKKAKTRVVEKATSTVLLRDRSLTSSPGESRQTTLDIWRASATPTKLRDTTATTDLAPISAAPQFRSTGTLDVLDLTLPSSQVSAQTEGKMPLESLSKYTASRSKRPVLVSTTSNGSRASSRSSSSTTINTMNQSKQAKARSDRTDIQYTPPGFQEPLSLAQEVQTSDPFLPQLEALPSTSPKSNAVEATRALEPAQQRTVDTLDLTLLSSSPATSPVPPNIRRSPRNHISPPPTKTSPPAAWKSRERRKRQIVLRKSVVGAWDYVDIEDSPMKTGTDIVPKGKDRKKWRESEVQVLDLS